MIGDSVFAKLQSLNTTLELNLTDAWGNQRIYPNYVRMGEKQYPQLVYDCQNYEEDTGLDGHAETATLDVKVLTVAQDYDGADDMAKAIVTALNETSGTWGTTTVQGCFLEEVAEEHFVDTDMETILYFTKEITFHVSIVI
jgi:hypothetical protein